MKLPDPPTLSYVTITVTRLLKLSTAVIYGDLP